MKWPVKRSIVIAKGRGRYRKNRKPVAFTWREIYKKGGVFKKGYSGEEGVSKMVY